MDSIKKIIYRNLTDADFFNINKPPGMEEKGGGQSYIDFPMKTVHLSDWDDFFQGVNKLTKSQVTNGPCWHFPVYSIGIDHEDETDQILKVYQRRGPTIIIASQKLISSASNRVKSWLPENGFPKPMDNRNPNQCPDGLMVYLASTYGGKVWAGWYLNDGTSIPPFTGENPELFGPMFSGNSLNDGASGVLSLDEGVVFIEPSDINTPLRVNGQAPEPVSELTEKEIEEELENVSKLFEEDFGDTPAEHKEQIVKTRIRNTKIVKKLKELYQHQCQITGLEFVFPKKNGINYTEAHHLISLGSGGADNPQNLVILSPLVHKMLHFADVPPIHLDDIVFDSDGGASLNIMINEQEYTINWHPEHAALFAK
jgi:5-methylcytosine-specific restriction enzyme A